MEIGFDYDGALRTALADARAAASAAARVARRAESAFDGARASNHGEQAAAERFRGAHRAHVEALTEVAETEAALEEQGVLAEDLAQNQAPEDMAA